MVVSDLVSDRWAMRAPPPEGLGSTLQGHNRGLQFHLCLSDCRVVSPDLLNKQCLTSLDASVRLVKSHRTGTKAPILEIQKFFFQSPNLRSFSLATLNAHGGQLQRSVPAYVTTNFQLSGQEKFPPLEQLRLDGYFMRAPEWVLWRDRMDWRKLTSLTLERQAIANLSHMQGVVQNLK